MTSVSADHIILKRMGPCIAHTRGASRFEISIPIPGLWKLENQETDRNIEHIAGDRVRNREGRLVHSRHTLQCNRKKHCIAYIMSDTVLSITGRWGFLGKTARRFVFIICMLISLLTKESTRFVLVME